MKRLVVSIKVRFNLVKMNLLDCKGNRGKTLRYEKNESEWDREGISSACLYRYTVYVYVILILLTK